MSTGPAPAKKAVIVMFKELDGHRTSLSLAPGKWATLLALEQDEKALTGLIRQVATTAPADGKRSLWVYETVLAQLHARRSPS